MNTTDIALNVAWALLCIGALAMHWARERGKSHARGHKVHRMLSVFLAAVSLFPCISASDDGIQLRNLAGMSDHSSGFNRSHTGNLPLLAQLEDLQHAQTSTPFVLLLVLCFFLMIRIEHSSSMRLFPADSLSRAPPAF